MQIKRFIEQETKTQTYIIHRNNKATIIDSVFSDVDLYLDFIKSNNLQLLYSLDTHVHADHITGSSKIREKTGCKIAMGKYAGARGIDVLLEDDQELNLEDLSIKTLYTPGHTNESCCYLIEGRLFTGDTLLINACGRTDFQNGSAEDLYDSIFNKLLMLPCETLVYPGHDYNNRFVSSIADEKANNPRLQVESKQDFINIMNNLKLPKPKFIDIAVPRNLLCGADI